YRAHLDLHSFPTRRSSDLFLVKLYGTQTTLESINLAVPNLNEIILLININIIYYNQGNISRQLIDVNPKLKPLSFKFLIINPGIDRKSTRLNSSHVKISYA